MRAFAAIVNLTFRHALRSHIFKLLLGILLFSVIFIPSTVSGSTAGDFIRISLLYSLSAVSVILALSSIWLGCYVMTHDVDSYQLHMVVAKPVSRVTIWLAKWTGVNLVNLSLLVLASAAIYGIILYRFGRENFPEQERQRIRNEVMVGRRVYLPRRPDFGEMAREIVRRDLEKLRKQGVTPDSSSGMQEKMLKDAQLKAVSSQSEVLAGRQRVWIFDDLPAGGGKPVFLRYRVYVNKVASEEQRMTRLWWHIGIPQSSARTANGVMAEDRKAAYDLFMYPMKEYPQQVMSGEFHELVIPPEWKAVTPDNRIVVATINYDDQKTTQFFQPADGPKLLIQVCGFLNNYSRAVLIIALELLILSGFGCAFGGCMSMPVAVFVVIAYLLFGSFSVYLTNLDYLAGTADAIGVFIAKMLLVVVIPLQVFEATGPVSGGELIEWSMIGSLLWSYFICRALPLFLLGIYLYRRRELGLIIRK